MYAFSLRTGLYALLASLFAVSVSSAQTFQQTTYRSPNRPSDLFVADLNHDGKPDIVTTQFTSNMITVFLNHGDGTFTPGGSATYVIGGSSPQRMLIADFNHDNNPDIVVGTCNPTGGPSSVSILFGNGDGSFRNHIDYSIQGCITGLGSIKIAHDTSLSLIVASELPQINILRNDGTGTFHLQTISTTSNMSGVSAADYNHDGIADIAAIEVANPNRLVILNGNASGGFSAPQVIQSASSTVGFFAANTVDFTGDGVGDLLVPWDSPGPVRAGVMAFANNGFGKFTSTNLNVASSYFLTGFRAAEGDFTGQGFHGLILPLTGTGTQVPDAVAYFPARSKGVWGAPIYLSMGANSSPQSASVADFDGDGLLDFAVITESDDTLHIFRNTSCGLPPKPGIEVCSPTGGSTQGSPVPISATANVLTRPITAMKAYIDGKQVASSDNNMVNASMPEPAGKHTLTINAWDSSGKLYQSVEIFTVQ
jgi:hypothetical protein